MISGTSKVLALTVLMTISLGASANAPELLARLSRQGPSEIGFVEFRFSKMLKQPVRAEGTLRYTDAQILEREVVRPVRERTTIHDKQVTVAREGARPRSIALDRAPELRVLLNSFSALLTGDSVALERDFNVTAEEANGTWRIRLTPKNAKLQQRVPELSMQGAADELRCFTMTDARGGATIMVLGVAAEQLPTTTDRARIEQHCRGT